MLFCYPIQYGFILILLQRFLCVRLLLLSMDERWWWRWFWGHPYSCPPSPSLRWCAIQYDRRCSSVVLIAHCHFKLKVEFLFSCVNVDGHDGGQENFVFYNGHQLHKMYRYMYSEHYIRLYYIIAVTWNMAHNKLVPFVVVGCFSVALIKIYIKLDGESVCGDRSGCAKQRAGRGGVLDNQHHAPSIYHNPV